MSGQWESIWGYIRLLLLLGHWLERLAVLVLQGSSGAGLEAGGVGGGGWGVRDRGGGGVRYEIAALSKVFSSETHRGKGFHLDPSSDLARPETRPKERVK